MKTLEILIDRHTKTPNEIFFYDGEEAIYTEEINGTLPLSNKGKFGLILLAAETAFSRHPLLKSRTGTNSLIKTSEFIDALFDIASRNQLDATSWGLTFFGTSPKGKYLRSQQIKGEKSVSFTDATEISIKWSDNLVALSPNELAALKKRLESYVDAKHHVFHYKLDVIDSHRNNTITPESTRGGISNSCEVSLNISYNFDIEISVFWIRSDNSLSPLYPFADKLLRIENSSPELLDGHWKLIIPEDEYFTIQGSPGIDTCIILTRSERFTHEEIDIIWDNLKKALDASGYNRAFRTPKSNKIQLDQVLELPSQGAAFVSAPRSVTAWETMIAKTLQGSAEVVHFFHIPHLD